MGTSGEGGGEGVGQQRMKMDNPRYASAMSTSPMNRNIKLTIGALESNPPSGFFRYSPETSQSPSNRHDEARTRMHSRKFEREHVSSTQLQVKSKQRVPVGEDAAKAFSGQYHMKSDFFVDPLKSQTYKNVRSRQSSWHYLDAVPTKTLKLVLDRKMLENDLSTPHPESLETVKQRMSMERVKAQQRANEVNQRRQRFRLVFQKRKVLNDTLEQKAGVIKSSLIPPRGPTPDTEIVSRLKSPKCDRVVKGRTLPSECSGMIATTYENVYKRMFATPTPSVSRDSPEFFLMPEALRKQNPRPPISMTPVPRLTTDSLPKTRLSVNLSASTSPKARAFVTSPHAS